MRNVRIKRVYHLLQPAKTSVSPRSSPPGTFLRAKRPSGEERGETDVFAGYFS